jgi:glycosyltransferase involved in cell wall biosynthesis
VTTNANAGLRVQIVVRPVTAATGTGRYTAALIDGLTQTGVTVEIAAPEMPRLFLPVAAALRPIGFDLAAFFGSYPLRAPLNSPDVLHISAQTLATFLHVQRPRMPVVITVLDIIPYLVRDDAALNTLQHPADRQAYRLALAALHRADALLAISEYTARTLVDALGIARERVHVTYPGVDQAHFRPQPVPDDFRVRYGLGIPDHTLLYVGSEDPRKNLPVLIEALALLRGSVEGGDVRLWKVGRAQFQDERTRLVTLIAKRGLTDAVQFFDEVPDADLPLFYNAADVFVMPSRYEGFGLPVVEAMACGTPAVVADATALPELVGDTGFKFAPDDPAALAAAVQQAWALPHDPDRWRAQAAKFTWARTVHDTLAVYRMLIGQRAGPRAGGG